MTTLQKGLIAATVSLGIVTGLYEARQASLLRTQVQTLQKDQVNRIEQVQRERDNTLAKLTAANEELGRLRQDLSELLKLRAEVTRLRSETQPTTRLQAGAASNPIEATAMSWVTRVVQLKQRLQQTPDAGIPELQLLDEEDWLAVVKGRPLETDIDYRRAMSALRHAAETKLASRLQKALQGFARRNQGGFPTELGQLQSYFDPPVDAAMLDRWKIAPKEAVPSVDVGEVIVTQKAPAVDEVFDTRTVIGSGGGLGGTDFLSPETREALQPVYDAYRAAHNGQWQLDFTELQPYARTPEQQAALQKMILRNSSAK